jgi:hypothetical protein
MATLAMSSSSVRSSVSEIFSKKVSFGLYLTYMKKVNLMKSPKQGIPFIESKDDTIWISNKLKPEVSKDATAFANNLVTNGSDYEIGLTIPSAEYPTASWILYKKGEAMQSTVLATISAPDTVGAEVIAAVK